jgi:heme exporter protein D
MGEEPGDGAMSFHSFSAFIDMGGHGEFVWSAYGIALVIIVFNFVRPIMLKKRNLAQLRKQLSSEETQSERELVQ